MATAQEQYRIAQNILARIGIDGDLISEHARAMSQLHGMQTMAEMNVPQTPQATISGQPDQSTAQPVNTPTMPQNEGQGAMNLPI